MGHKFKTRALILGRLILVGYLWVIGDSYRHKNFIVDSLGYEVLAVNFVVLEWVVKESGYYPCLFVYSVNQR